MTRLTSLTSVLALVAGGALAQESHFNRVASFATPSNMAEGEDLSRESSAEIITVTEDGMTLVYSDSPLGVIGIVDITDPANPVGRGNIALDGEPTAVSALGNTVFVGINTSESFTAPSGHLLHIDLATGEAVADCDLGGQPDSTAVAPDGSFVTVAVENERDEDAGDGRVPQMPAGYVAIVPLTDGQMDCAAMVKADLTGIAEVAPEDPEPEFVDVSPAGEIAVTLQENNHIAVLNAAGEVVSHFSAGSVTLEGVDTQEDGRIVFDGTAENVVREPDALQWIDADHFAVANEGDMDGGSRGFTVFRKDGAVVYDSGMSFEHAVAAIGHYPEGRSDAKGVEPEGMEFATFGDVPMMFLLSERGSVVGVYDMTNPAAPALRQILPSGISPEGVVAVPGRDLLAVANEVDLGEDGLARAHVTVYARQEGPAAYPHLTSEGLTEDGRPVAWTANSGMVADGAFVWFVNDSYLGAQPSIFKVNVSQTPARIVEVIRVTRDGMPAQKLDIEGIALDGEGGFWLASEGRTDRLIPHAIYHVGSDGAIESEIPFPPELLAVETRFGAEGITRVGNTLWIAIQREWGDDPKGMVKLVSYNLETEEWGAVHYPLDAPTSGWVGLSEIVAHGDWVYVVERDNLVGGDAVTKKVYRVSADVMVPAALGGPLPVVTKEEVRDLLPDLTSAGGYVLDKVEGLAIMEDGTVWVSTDNDGVDDHSGETMFWSFTLN